MATTLTPEVRDVLLRAKCAGNALHLPPGLLTPKLYASVNDAIEAIGGKWNRKARAHVFDDDPGPLVDGLLTSGVKPPKNPDAFFPTPRAVVDVMLNLASLENFSTIDSPHVLEPSAGDGAIVDVIRARYPHVTLHCIEKHERRAVGLSNAGHLHVWNSDFLHWDAEAESGITDYDAVLMNPPFTVERDPVEWMEHVYAAHALLAPRHGVLIAVVPSGFATRTDKRHTKFRAFAERHGCVSVTLPPDAFKESGTGVNAMIIALHAAPSTGGRL